MNVENGIVVRVVTGWLRRRGWVVVPPSGVGGIAGVCGVSRCGSRPVGVVRDESRALRALREAERMGGGAQRPAPGAWPPPPGTYC